MVIKNVNTKETVRYNDQPGGIPLAVGLKRLEDAEIIIAHNAIEFDVPVLRKLYPNIKIDDKRVLDTLVMARLIYPDTYDKDQKLVLAGKLDKALVKRHSLKAWGQRLGEHKADYDGGFESWNLPMEDYCEQDVHTLGVLYLHLLTKQCSPSALRLEHDVRWIITRQEKFGFPFNVVKAAALYVKLSKRKIELEGACKEVFKPFYVRDGKTSEGKGSRRTQVEELGLDYKRPLYEGKGKEKKQVGYYYKTMDYTDGVPYTKVKLLEFNPGSRDHIANRLTKLFGWQPKEFTNSGKPEINETVLESLVYPQAKVLQEYFLVDKRISQLAEGNQAWLKKEKDGRLYCRLNTMGAVTSRMTHSEPNLAQVPAVKKNKNGEVLWGDEGLYGADCRELFEAPKGMVMVGADASGLELRALAGYMAKWDGGKYIITVCEGRNEDGTDIHTVNQKALGIDSRDTAKTFIYAFLYGAGDEKIGVTLYNSKGTKARRQGREAKDNFTNRIPAIGKLIQAVQKAAKKKGWIKGLDERAIPIRSAHAALNTLLQSAGAIIMKRALVILDDSLKVWWVPGVDYEFMANIHDEWQIACIPEIADEVGRLAVQAIKESGEFYDFKCPLTGEYKVGTNWKETH
ncbi:DNA polymerase [Methylovorus sp. MM2]|uniref:DNA polymerase n=1 Tax=Methylovorus sp. MM2 TaxID=1848038 RepID=UPI0013F4D071|nr:DNA polymerase [Methylovorus sp. MM2]